MPPAITTGEQESARAFPPVARDQLFDMAAVAVLATVGLLGRVNEEQWSSLRTPGGSRRCETVRVV